MPIRRNRFALYRFAETNSRYADSLKAISPKVDSPNSDSPNVNILNKEQKIYIIPYVLFNNEWAIVFCFILYYYSSSLFRRIGSIPYLSRMQNEEKKKVCVQYSLIYNTDVTLGRRLRKLYLSARTAKIFTRPSF